MPLGILVGSSQGSLNIWDLSFSLLHLKILRDLFLFKFILLRHIYVGYTNI